MKGLLLKEFYMAGKYCRSSIFVMLCFSLSSLLGVEYMFFVFFPILILSMLPMTLMAYDERSRWEVYSDTLPYSRAQMVSAKYLVGLIGTVSAIFISTLVQCVRMNQSGNFTWNELAVWTVIAWIIGLLAPSMLLPLIFKYGVEKGRIIYYIGIGGSSAMVTFLFKSPELWKLLQEIEKALLIILTGCIVLYVISWLLSIRIYRKKEL